MRDFTPPFALDPMLTVAVMGLPCASAARHSSISAATLFISDTGRLMSAVCCEWGQIHFGIQFEGVGRRKGKGRRESTRFTVRPLYSARTGLWA